MKERKMDEVGRKKRVKWMYKERKKEIRERIKRMIMWMRGK